MIYTVTFNPSLDYVVQIENLTLGEVNRTSCEAIYPGGKGNNVSVVLANLGMKSRALGFIAGFTGDALEKMLTDFGCTTDFIRLKEGMTRINVKINASEESEINGQGPEITAEAIRELFEKLEQIQEGDILVLAGRKIHIVVDATKDLLLNVLKYHPFLIKPNNHELEELFGVTLKQEEDIIVYARKLQEMGAVNVLISMAGDGALLLTEDGKVYRKMPPKGNVVNSVGAGDSMVAGFLTGYLNTNNYEKALQLGIAAGSASAFLSWLAGKDEIVKLLQQPPEEYGL